MSKVTFNNKGKLFFAFINEQVEKHFSEGKIKKSGNRKLYIKSIIMITVAFATYITLITVSMHWLLALFLCCLLGFGQACVGFNVMHDANHGSFSGRKWVNRYMGLTANMMGVNAWMWKQKHNVIHHTYTNIDGIDDDIGKSSLLRMCPSQKKLWIHRYQYIYCIPLYSLTSLVWTFGSDFSKYFSKKIQSTDLNKMEAREHVIFWSSKILYVFFYLLLPMYLIGVVPAIVGFAAMHVTLGLTLALVFQLAHIVEATHFIEAGEEEMKIENEWAIHQAQTTADFATNNKVISWITGGLNYQVEHHLFPKISHIHYPEISKFVKKACEEFSIKYNAYPSMFSALRSHLRFMKHLGTN